MKVTTHFYSLINHTEETVSFQVRKDLTSENGTPAEERDFLSNGSEYIFEQNTLMAKRNSFRGFHSTLDIGVDQIGFFSPPRMNDLKIFPYSNKVANLSKTHDFEEIKFSIMNRLNFGFLGAESYTDIVINLYWFDDLRREFILVGSDFLKGVYQFNHDYTVALNFKTSDKSLVKTISINGGRFLYLKVMDFKIIELNRFYNQVLNQVQGKSIAVMTSDTDKSVIKYIGVNGRPTPLKTILERAISDKVQVLNDRIVRIGSNNESTTLEKDPYGDNGLTLNKWFLLTNEINNNPFAYSFSPKDIINLSYLTSTNPFGLIPSYFGNIATTESYQSFKTIKVLRDNFLDLRLNLRPTLVTVPVNSAKRLLNCSSSPLAKSCFDYSHEVKTLKGIQALQISSILYITLNNVEFRLDQLIEQKNASFRVKNSEVIEIKFSDSLIRLIPESNGITITFFTKPTKVAGCTGIIVCESSAASCDRYVATPPTCEESTTNSSYILKDLTKKTFYPVIGEMFFSVEYI
jgi:hypothetical protein